MSEFVLKRNPVKVEIRVIDDSSWLIGDKLLMTHTRSGQHTWGDGRGGGYTISDAPSPLPQTRPLPDDSEISVCYRHTDRRVVYFIGEAVLKIKGLDLPQITREHVTLAWLHERKQPNWSFSIPDVFYHTENDDFEYTVMRWMPGLPIGLIWNKLDESSKQQVAKRLADSCKELAIPADDTRMVGVDGNPMSSKLTLYSDSEFDPILIQKHCLEIGMDCSKLFFQHCDLTPGNVMLDPKDLSLSIIDWEAAGFFPVEWIRTHFCYGAAMKIPGEGINGTDGYGSMVEAHLAQLGFPQLTDEYIEALSKSLER